MNNPHRMHHLVLPLVAVLMAALIGGCGGGQKDKKDRGFFTSGNRDADQRAEQRMAKTEQIRGEGEGSGEKKKDADQKRPLFDRLGGDKGINALVDDWVARALADPRVNWERKGVTRGGMSFNRNKSVEWNASADNVAKMKTHIAQFLSVATGGPPKYEGREMKDVHAGLHITNAEFDASVGDLKTSLDKLGIPNQEQK